MREKGFRTGVWFEFEVTTKGALLYSPTENMCVLRSCVAKARPLRRFAPARGIPLRCLWQLSHNNTTTVTLFRVTVVLHWKKK